MKTSTFSKATTRAVDEVKRLRAANAELIRICTAVEFALRLCLKKELAPSRVAWEPLQKSLAQVLAKAAQS